MASRKEIPGKTSDSIRPGKPYAVSSTDTSVKLKWKPSDSCDITHYEIRYRDTGANRWLGHISTVGKNNSVTIKDLSPSARYQFKVRAITKNGSESNFSEESECISIDESSDEYASAPEDISPPGRPQVTDVTPSTITIKWKKPSVDHLPIDHYEVKYKEIGKNRWTTIITEDDNSKRTVDGLKADTVYQFKVRAIDEEDEEGPFSDLSLEISTAKEHVNNNPQAETQPSKPLAYEKSSEYVSIIWEKPQSTKFKIDRYEVRYKQENVKKWERGILTDDNVTKATIPGLEPETCYKFKVRALSEEDEEGPFSDPSDGIVTNGTTKETPLPTKLDQRAELIPGKPVKIASNKNTISLKWEKPKSSIHKIERYEVRYRTEKEKKWDGRILTDDTDTKATIIGLEPETSYKFKVRALSEEDEEGPFSDVSDGISTNDPHFAKADPPRDVRSTPGKPFKNSSTKNTITLIWEKPKSSKHKIERYEIRYRTANAKKWDGRTLTDDPNTKATILGLQEKTSYQFKVRALSEEDEEGPFSDVSDQIATEGIMNDPPVPRKPDLPRNDRYVPEKPVKIASTPNTISIGWGKPRMKRSPIDYYEIKYRKLGSKKWEGLKSTEDATPRLEIRDLNPCTAYQFIVRAVGEDESEFSEVSEDMSTDAEQEGNKSSKRPEEEEPGATPGQPIAMESTSDAVMLFWQKPMRYQDPIGYYEVKYKKLTTRVWSTAWTDDESPKIKLTGLEPSTTYQFKVRPYSLDGNEGPFGAISEKITTQAQPQQKAENTVSPWNKKDLKPGQPVEMSSTIETITLSWEEPSVDQTFIDTYEIRYSQVGSSQWKIAMTEDDNPNITISGLESATQYRFEVRAVMTTGEKGKYARTSDPICTKAPVEEKPPVNETSEAKPGKPHLLEATSTTLKFNWNDSAFEYDTVDYYEIRYRLAGESRWNEAFFTKDASLTATATKLSSKTSYYFKVRAVMKSGDESPFSEVSDVLTTNEWKLGSPMEEEATSTSLTINWTVPDTMPEAISSFEVKYRKVGEKFWTNCKTEDDKPRIQLSELRCDTKYHFRVRAIMESGEEGPFSDVSQPIATIKSLAQELKSNCTQTSKGPPAVFKVTLNEDGASRNPKAKTRKCLLGSREPTSVDKTIMVVGATGAGKSTLIDGMINFILDVAWEDESRFSLVDLTDEEKARETTQAVSQTEWITCYTINKLQGSQIKYNLTIIDTPGFGDTRGIERDKELIEQIRTLFTTKGATGIDALDAVCFVTPGPLARLTPTQRYIFDQILSLFGKDIAENIFVLITFADGNEPPVKSALKAAEVPFQKTFVFNNSALFVDAESCSDKDFSEMFWKMGKKSFSLFFDELQVVETRSLLLSSQVLETRKQLEATIQGLQPQIQAGLDTLEKIRQESKQLQGHKVDIDKNRNFEYEVEETHQRQVNLPTGKYVTNCLTCNFTCHYPCGIADDNNKRNCSSMWNGSCTVCPQKCIWSNHKNNQYRFETYTKKVKKTYDEMKKQYNVSLEEGKKQETVLQKIQGAYETVKTNVRQLVKKISDHVNDLRKIALVPNPLSEIEYIDVLIMSEQQAGKDGYQARIRALQELRQQAELKGIDENYDPFGDKKI